MSWSSHSHDVTTHGVAKRVSCAAAPRSRHTRAFLWRWSTDAGHEESYLSSIAALTIADLCSPHATSKISLACMIVSIPIVTALTGTWSIEPNMTLASSLELLSKSTNRVGELKDEPGSLKPILPHRPIPKSWKSIPPASAIIRSYLRQKGTISSLRIFHGMVCIFSGSTSTWSSN